MKYLKWAGITLGSLILIFILLGIFMSKEFSIEKDGTIEASPSTVYNILNDISLQEQWNPWLIEDETMKVTYAENTIGEGAAYTYTSDNYGGGSELITKSVPNSQIDVQIAFDEEEPGQITYLLSPDGENTKLTWKFDGRMGFPGNVFIPMMKWQIGKSMKKGIRNLDKLAEERWVGGKYYGFEIKYDQLPERHFVIKRKVVPKDNVQQFYLSNLGSLFQAVQTSGQQMDGKPCGLYFAEDKVKNNWDMAAGIPVTEVVDIEDAASLTMNEGRGLIIDHYGDYATLSQAHLAMETYMRDREMVHHAPFIEEYLSDPSEEDDPNKVLTKIYFYLAETGITK